MHQKLKKSLESEGRGCNDKQKSLSQECRENNLEEQLFAETLITQMLSEHIKLTCCFMSLVFGFH